MTDDNRFSMRKLSEEERARVDINILIGQFALREDLEAAQLPEHTIDAAFSEFPELVRKLAQNIVSPESYADLIDFCSRALEGADKNDDLRRLLDLATAEAESHPSGSLSAGKGEGGNWRTLAWLAVFALALAKFGAGIDSEGHWFVEEKAGIPAGVLEIVEVVGDAIAALKNKIEPTGTKSPPRAGGPGGQGGTSHLDGLAGKGLEHQSPAFRKASSASQGTTRSDLRFPDLPLAAVDGHFLSKGDAIALAEEIGDFFDHIDILGAVGIDVEPDQIFLKSEGFKSKRPWPHVHSVKVGTGILLHRGSGNYSDSYRIAVRLQSQFELRVKVWKAIANWFDDRCKDLVSVRWISRVHTLASNPSGSLGKWAGAAELRKGEACGAAINAAGGAVGAATMLARFGGEIHMITAGHVPQDDRSVHQNGIGLYSPVQNDSPSEAAAATVLDGSIFPPYVPGRNFVAREPVYDFARAKVMNGHIPSDEKCRVFNGHRINFPPASAHALNAQGHKLKVMKGAARSKICYGLVESVETNVVVANELTGTDHFARRLIEVSLDRSHAISAGDSGALLSVETDTGYKPLGIVVAGALNSRLRGHNSVMTSALYAVPLTAIPGIEKMEAV